MYHGPSLTENDLPYNNYRKYPNLVRIKKLFSRERTIIRIKKIMKRGH